MAETRPVAMMDVMRVLDLATATDTDFQRALTQAAHRVAQDQGITLDETRVTQAAQVVQVLRQGSDAAMTQTPPTPTSLPLWAARPASEAERQQHLRFYSTGWRGWLRRWMCNDQGQAREDFAPVLMETVGLWVSVLMALACCHHQTSFMAWWVAAGALGATALLMAETFEERFKRVLPATISADMQAHLQGDATAQAVLQRLQASPMPLLLEGDLDTLMRHWITQLQQRRGRR